MKFLLFVLLGILSGCVTQVGPKEFAKPQPCPTAKPVQCPAEPKLDMPGIPLTVNMKIRGNNVLECDAGCEIIIRNYAAAQKLLR